MSDFAFDPFDPKQTQHMWDRLARMRREAPVTRPIPGFVFVARYHDVRAVFRDTVTYSAREGFRGPGVVLPYEESFLGELDPPEHPKLRMLMMQAFRPGMERAAEPFTRAWASRKLDAIAAKGGGDLVSELGIHLPPAVTAHMLGIPTEHIERVGQWGFELLHSTWPQLNRTERGEGLGGAFPELAQFLDEQIERRRESSNPPDDLITRMTRAEVDGRKLSSLQIRTLCANCLLASQSTANLVGNLLYRFASDVELERRLRAQPSLITSAVEESLRFDAPVLFLFRTARIDHEIARVPVRAGERIIMGIASGNRDETVWERADEFWLERDWKRAPEILTFGPGPHLCLGNQIARIEARVVLELVIEKFAPRALRMAKGFTRALVPMFLEYGPESLEVAID
ncbi:MAG: cytochrome P450 [Deltaproteobacteria bacterium]|nr:cytochrome P450 [Deltaproteobacteria bacterium]